ncbi:hypothetical protein NQ315_007572 [Exocentrus adspersus]|uniref:Transmembrane protein n=1 Tax=Exocentrus adspersus TaxID=1586481 RepID=A0AAV8W8C6_9CUCU|nr:hypothetical protein NQ315_007572 [Exocentrus adspersus]
MKRILLSIGTNKMAALRILIITTCVVSCVLARYVDVGGRRFMDVPSSCAEGMTMVHSGDCVQPFSLGSGTSNATNSTTMVPKIVVFLLLVVFCTICLVQAGVVPYNNVDAPETSQCPPGQELDAQNQCVDH